MNVSTRKLLMNKVPTGQLADMPIDPALIIAGNPVARGEILMQSSDKKMTCGAWSCEPGSFNWEFTWDEFVSILAGTVTISEEGGDAYTLGAGDTAHFPLGLRTRWEVTETVRKFFVLRTPEPFIL